MAHWEVPVSKNSLSQGTHRKMRFAHPEKRKIFSSLNTHTKTHFDTP